MQRHLKETVFDVIPVTFHLQIEDVGDYQHKILQFTQIFG